jgi:hypothetical protein
VDPSFDDPPSDPSACAVAHEHRNLACRFLPWAPRTLINDGLQLLDSSARTKLTERAVKRLAPGKRVSASGTLVTSYDYDVNDPAIDEHQRGRERFKYTLTVRRVR